MKLDLRSDEDTINKLHTDNLKAISFDEGKALAILVGAYSYVECSARTVTVAHVFIEAVNAWCCSDIIKKATEHKCTIQ